MKINFNKQTLYTLIIGMCVGVVTILAMLILTGGVPWLRAAGVGSGAADVNARYLDGYGTAITTSVANTVLVTDGSAYLPDNSVDSGAIVNATIVAGDIATDTITASQIAANAVGTSEILDGTITTTDISSTAGITGTQIAESTILTNDIGANTITADDIAANAVGTSEIIDDTIAAADIAANAVGASELADSSVGTGAITDGAINNVDIGDTAAIAKTKISAAGSWTVAPAWSNTSCSGTNCWSNVSCSGGNTAQYYLYNYYIKQINGETGVCKTINEYMTGNVATDWVANVNFSAQALRTCTSYSGYINVFCLSIN